MSENTLTIEKSFLEKIAPFVLLAMLALLGYYGFTKLNIGGTPAGTVVVNQPQKIQANVDVAFLTSPEFMSLKFIPDSPVFDPATGTIPQGREDPFAPVY